MPYSPPIVGRGKWSCVRIGRQEATQMSDKSLATLAGSAAERNGYRSTGQDDWVMEKEKEP